MAWPKDWSGKIGRRIVVVGLAVNSKLGARLQAEEGTIWIDGLDAWPPGFYSGGGRGTRLRVTGTVIRKEDLAAFVHKPGELERAGIPVQSETELETARRRYLLKGASWTVLE